MAKAGHWSFALRRPRGAANTQVRRPAQAVSPVRLCKYGALAALCAEKRLRRPCLVAAAFPLPPCKRTVPAKGLRHCVCRKGGPDASHFNKFFAWRYDNEETNRKPSSGPCHGPEPCPLLGPCRRTGRDEGAGACDCGEQHLFHGRRRSLGRYPCGHMGRDRRKLHHDGLRRRSTGGSRSYC